MLPATTLHCPVRLGCCPELGDDGVLSHMFDIQSLLVVVQEHCCQGCGKGPGHCSYCAARRGQLLPTWSCPALRLWGRTGASASACAR